MSTIIKSSIAAISLKIRGVKAFFTQMPPLSIRNGITATTEC